jgi:hypothetical protein
MPLTEQYMRGILRPPPANPAALGPNPPHPFQQSFMYYFRQRFMKHHTPWIIGYGVSIYVFMQIDKAMQNGKKASFEHAVADGHAPGEPQRSSATPVPVAGRPRPRARRQQRRPVELA